MPHFICKDYKSPKLPFSSNNLTFEYEVTNSNNSDKMVFVKYDGEIKSEFFILIQKREKDTIVKALKSTRPSVVGMLKQSLRILKDYQEVISHNLDNDKLAQNTYLEYLKKQSDFENFDEEFILEIGFGSGRNLLKMANENRHIKHIGIEIHTPSIMQVLRQIKILNLDNLYILNDDARNFLFMLPSNKCLGVYLHFPIPFNEAKHRRVISKEFFINILRILKPSHCLHLRSDDKTYVQDALEDVLNFASADIKMRKNRAFDITSKYEARWERQKKDIFDLFVYSHEMSEEANDIGKLGKEEINFDNINIDNLKSIKKHKILENDYLLVINHIFIGKDAIVLSLCFGDLRYPISKIFVVDLVTCKGRFIGGICINNQIVMKACIKLKEILA